MSTRCSYQLKPARSLGAHYVHSLGKFVVGFPIACVSAVVLISLHACSMES